MRWLTRDALSGALTPEEEEDRGRNWALEREAVRPRLHSGAGQLLDLNVHDAVIRSLRQAGPDVELRALIGDNQVGYQWLTSCYRNARLVIVEPGVETGTSLFEILCDEVTVAADETFVHSVITWPSGEFDVQFSSVDTSLTPADGNDRKAMFARANASS